MLYKIGPKIDPKCTVFQTLQNFIYFEESHSKHQRFFQYLVGIFPNVLVFFGIQF